MRKLVLEIPHGEPANSESITPVEAKVPFVAQREPDEASESTLPKLSREQRRAALMKAFGILKGLPDAPQDGLAFQLEMRAE
ncbi:hypothetical protein ACLB1G_16625 [Oxalobacteraceae bacterium A2-2]